MKQHYHVLHGMAGMYLPNVNEVATTKQEAWNIAQWELRSDKEAGRKVTKVGKQEWQVVEEGTSYTCEITSCYDTDCVQAFSAYSQFDKLGEAWYDVVGEASSDRLPQGQNFR